MTTVLQWIQDGVWSEDEVEEITICGVEGDESRREVGCQWKSPREEEEKRKEVGYQRNAAVRRDAAVQVDLLTQQLSGVAWRCVSVREDGPGGGTLLHHCCAHLAAAENKHFQQTAPLPSMPPCEPLLLPLADASAAPPPGLIAPLSPRLAEEDEEEEDEGPLKSKSLCLKQSEPSAEKKVQRRRTLWVKQNKGGVKSRPGISTHIQMKTASDEERTQPDQSVKESNVGVKKKQPEETSQKCSRTSIQKRRPVTQTKDTQQQNEEGKEKRRNKKGAEGRVKPVWLKTKWVERQRRSVGPPIRFLLEYEEKSHGLSTANHVKEVKGKVIEEAEQTERTESRLVEASVGVEKQPCQLPISIHQEKYKPHLFLHRCHYQRSKDGSHGTRGPPASSQDSDGKLKEVAHAEVKVEKEKEKEKESLLPAPTEAPDGKTHKQSSPRKRRWQKNDDESASKRFKEEEAVKPVCVEKKEVKVVFQRPRRMMVGPPVRYLLESELPHRLVTANQDREEEEEQEDMTDQDEELSPTCRQGRPAKCMTDMEAVGGASETAESPKTVKRVTHWNSMNVQNQEDQTEVAIRMKKVRRWQDMERKKEAQLKRVIMRPQRPRRTMVGPPVRYLLESELSHHLVTASQERQEEEEQEGMTDQDEELSPTCRQGRPGKSMTDMEAVGGASETAEAPNPVKTLIHCNKMKAHRRPDFVNKEKRCSEKIEVQNQEGQTEETIRMKMERRRRDMERKKEAQLKRVIMRPQRLRRTMVGPPVRYLLESELPHPLVTSNLERKEEEEQEGLTDQDKELSPTCRQGRPGKCMTDMEAVGKASETAESPKPLKRVIHWNKIRRHRRPNFVINERRCSKKLEVQNWQNQTEEMIRMKKERRWQEKKRKKDAQLKRVTMLPQRLRRTLVGPPIRYLLESELPHRLVTANQERQEEEEQEDMTDQDESPSCRQGLPGKCVTDMDAVGRVSETAEAPKPVKRVIHCNKMKVQNQEDQTEEAMRTKKEKRRQEKERKREAQLERVVMPPQRLRRTMVGPPIRYLLESELPHHLGTANQERQEEEEQEDMTDQDEELSPVCRQGGPGKSITDIEAVGRASETAEAPKPVKMVMHWNKMKVQNQEDQTEEALKMKKERRWQEMERKKEAQLERMIIPPQRLRRTTVGPPVRYLLESEEPLHVPRAANDKKLELARKPLKITAEGGASGRRGKFDQPGDIPLREMPTSEIGNEILTDLTDSDESSPLKSQQKSPRKVGTDREAGGGAIVITNMSGAAEMQTGVIAMEVVWQDGGQMEKRWRREMDNQTKEVTRVVRGQKNRERGGLLKMEDELKEVMTPPPLLQRPRRMMVSPPVRYLVESEENFPGRANQDRAERRRSSKAGGGAYGDTSVIGGPGDSQGQSHWNLESPLIYIDPDSREATVLSPCSVNLQRLV